MVSIIQNMSLLWCYQERFEAFSDRIYRCDCGYVEDRDFNAALNLRDALTYEVA